MAKIELAGNKSDRFQKISGRILKFSSGHTAKGTSHNSVINGRNPDRIIFVF